MKRIMSTDLEFKLSDFAFHEKPLRADVVHFSWKKLLSRVGSLQLTTGFVSGRTERRWSIGLDSGGTSFES